jgi:hypothetical protein
MTAPETPLPGGAALNSPPPGGGKPYPPSQVQDIPDDQLGALWQQIYHDPGPTHSAVLDGLRWAYRVGYAAALGYQIEVTDAGVMVCDRGPGGCERCEQAIQPGEAYETIPGTGGHVQHLLCPNWSPPDLDYRRNIPDLWGNRVCRDQGGPS